MAGEVVPLEHRSTAECLYKDVVGAIGCLAQLELLFEHNSLGEEAIPKEIRAKRDEVLDEVSRGDDLSAAALLRTLRPYRSQEAVESLARHLHSAHERWITDEKHGHDTISGTSLKVRLLRIGGDPHAYRYGNTELTASNVHEFVLSAGWRLLQTIKDQQSKLTGEEPKTAKSPSVSAIADAIAACLERRPEQERSHRYWCNLLKPLEWEFSKVQEHYEPVLKDLASEAIERAKRLHAPAIEDATREPIARALTRHEAGELPAVAALRGLKKPSSVQEISDALSRSGNPLDKSTVRKQLSKAATAGVVLPPPKRTRKGNYSFAECPKEQQGE